MTPLESIKHGIETANWNLVAEGYNRLNPKNAVVVPQKRESQTYAITHDNSTAQNEPVPVRRQRTIPTKAELSKSQVVPKQKNSTSTRQNSKQIGGNFVNMFFDDLSECTEFIQKPEQKQVNQKSTTRKPKKRNKRKPTEIPTDVSIGDTNE